MGVRFRTSRIPFFLEFRFGFFRRLIRLALRCTNMERTKRPDCDEVVFCLENICDQRAFFTGRRYAFCFLVIFSLLSFVAAKTNFSGRVRNSKEIYYIILHPDEMYLSYLFHAFNLLKEVAASDLVSSTFLLNLELALMCTCFCRPIFFVLLVFELSFCVNLPYFLVSALWFLLYF